MKCMCRADKQVVGFPFDAMRTTQAVSHHGGGVRCPMIEKNMSKHGKRRWRKRLAIVAVFLAMAGGVAWHFKSNADDGPNYMTESVERGDLTQVVTATGSLNPVVNVIVGSQISGRICKLYVDFNSTVKSNQVIAEIDPSTYQAALEQAKADLANAKANEELQHAEAQRSSQLFTNKLVSGSDYDTATALWHEAEATVQMKQALLHTAEANLGYCRILSPVDGVVISRSVELGQTVASSFNTPTLFQIANDLTKMQIDTAVDEADIGGIKKGESADFTVGAYPNRTFHGSIIQVRNAPTTNSNVVTYDTVIGVTNSDYSLKPGMTASVSVVVARHNQVLEIPNAALRFQPLETAAVVTNAPASSAGEHANANPGGKSDAPSGREDGSGSRGSDEHRNVHTVYVMLSGDAAGKAPRLKAVQITTGITDNIHTEVLSGLKAGDQVVTGLAIPGLANASGIHNPFSPARRF
jgi:HlyD family secretion protein